MKDWICAFVGTIGGLITTLIGGWDMGIMALAVCMLIDYVMGLIVAGVFHRSNKSDNGAIDSRAGWKGLARKFATFMLVIVGQLIDYVLGTTFLRDAIVLSFLTNEVISIVENAGLMGLPLPTALTNALEVLSKKAGEAVKNDHDLSTKDEEK